MKITEITSDLVGKEISCIIDGKTIKSSKIQLEGDLYFICQDFIDGTDCVDKLGYKYSWCVDDGTLNSLSDMGVEKLRLINLEPNYEIY